MPFIINCVADFETYYLTVEDKLYRWTGKRNEATIFKTHEKAYAAAKTIDRESKTNWRTKAHISEV